MERKIIFLIFFIFNCYSLENKINKFTKVLKTLSKPKTSFINPIKYNNYKNYSKNNYQHSQQNKKKFDYKLTNLLLVMPYLTFSKDSEDLEYSNDLTYEDNQLILEYLRLLKKIDKNTNMINYKNDITPRAHTPHYYIDSIVLHIKENDKEISFLVLERNDNKPNHYKFQINKNLVVEITGDLSVYGGNSTTRYDVEAHNEAILTNLVYRSLKKDFELLSQYILEIRKKEIKENKLLNLVKNDYIKPYYGNPEYINLVSSDDNQN